jgi:NAD(P)-dependent dehydrogenase (short-subunit alcohol dehydrogenase family)
MPTERPARFQNRVVIVPGASSGIGRATALALGREGASVVAAGRREDRLKDVIAQIEQSGGRAISVTGDTREAAAAESFVRTAIEKFGQLDGLVHAAGVLGNGSTTATAPEEWDRVMDINVRAAWLMTRAAGTELAKRKGAVVHLSSVASNRPYANLVAYCVSKAAIDMLVKCAALDFAPDGVRVNAVNPGVVVTELHTVTRAVADYPAFLERSKTTHPLGRVGNADEIAALILFLLSDEAGWITGSTIAIDGGRALMSAR